MRTRPLRTSILAGLAGFAAGAGVAHADPIIAAQTTVAGIFDSYNVISFGDFGSSTQAYGDADSQGPMAIGGNAYINAFNVSPAVPNAPYGIVTGGNLSFANAAAYNSSGAQWAASYSGANINGNAFVGGSAILGPDQSLTTNCGTGFALSCAGGWSIEGNLTVNGTLTARDGAATGMVTANAGATSPINFANLQTTLEAASTALNVLPTGTVSGGNHAPLVLTGTSQFVNVFTVTAAQLALMSSLDVDIPAGSLAVVNVDDSAVSIAAVGFDCNDGPCTVAEAEAILFNMPNATALTLNEIGLAGSVLAPFANVTATNGNIEGSIAANAIVSAADYGTQGGFEYEWQPLDPIAEPGSLLILAGGLLSLAFWRRLRRRPVLA